MRYLPEAFAVVKNACRRLCGKELLSEDIRCLGDDPLRCSANRRLRPPLWTDFGNGEGEGKTLVATLPVYLNALTGRGVHVVTVKRLPGGARQRVDGGGLQS
jgi:preprotein translocase subunit SecA